ncbi:hypothetical protein F2P81_001592 [Scophthalmus maximus]|uniref:Hepcidin-like n=1 Tax=Scophthalmus maximus TaxID=52904 RepID=A0A6A4TGI9_SCOMX|nr:hypothetical protein F2P81_001592 [Scophthalmus maximus]
MKTCVVAVALAVVLALICIQESSAVPITDVRTFTRTMRLLTARVWSECEDILFLNLTKKIHQQVRELEAPLSDHNDQFEFEVAPVDSDIVRFIPNIRRIVREVIGRTPAYTEPLVLFVGFRRGHVRQSVAVAVVLAFIWMQESAATFHGMPSNRQKRGMKCKFCCNCCNMNGCGMCCDF